MYVVLGLSFIYFLVSIYITVKKKYCSEYSLIGVILCTFFGKTGDDWYQLVGMLIIGLSLTVAYIKHRMYKNELEKLAEQAAQEGEHYE